MAYTAPTISTAGLQTSSYSDILAYLIDAYQNIYGSTTALIPATPDYELLSIFALMVSDCNSGLQLTYQQRSPSTAIATGLDAVVSINGLTRGGATYSTVQLTLTGSANATITNGVASDSNGNLWALPTSITLDGTGVANVVATCETAGDIVAPAGTVTGISTPQAGWQSVTNPVAATPGADAEPDSALRERQAVSVAGPSTTPLGSVIAAVAAVPGVTRYLALENPTSAVDSYGNPAHSISIVVEGGTEAAIAQAIYSKKTIGCFTNPGPANGVTVTVTDPASAVQVPISFMTPQYVPVYVVLNVKQFSTYTSQDTTNITNAVVNYLNALPLGSPAVYMGDLFSAAMSANTNNTFVIRSVYFGSTANPTTSADLTLTYNEAVQGFASNISIVSAQ